MSEHEPRPKNSEDAIREQLLKTAVDDISIPYPSHLPPDSEKHVQRTALTKKIVQSVSIPHLRSFTADPSATPLEIQQKLPSQVKAISEGAGNAWRDSHVDISHSNRQAFNEKDMTWDFSKVQHEEVAGSRTILTKVSKEQRLSYLRGVLGSELVKFAANGAKTETSSHPNPFVTLSYIAFCEGRESRDAASELLPTFNYLRAEIAAKKGKQNYHPTWASDALKRYDAATSQVGLMWTEPTTKDPRGTYIAL